MLLEKLKENNEDFEWYPTTNEILHCIKEDLIKESKHEKYKWNNYKSNIYYEKNNDELDTLYIDSLIDIGAGDGRVLKFFQEDDKNNCTVSISKKYGIEKATLQGDNLVKNGVALIGRDFTETVLIDRKFFMVFCNPPYSEYKEWCIKIAKEVNAEYIYLVIPERWKNDDNLLQLFKDCGDVEIIGNFDFLNAERQARAKVDIIRIENNKSHDTFRLWVEENIGRFESNNEINLQEKEETLDGSERKQLKKVKEPKSSFFKWVSSWRQI